AGPAGMGTVFLSRFSNPSNNTLAYATFSSNIVSSTVGAAWEQTAFSMPGACTFNAIYVSGTTPNASFLGANTLTYTLYKNNAATGLTVNLAGPTTLNQNAQANATGSVTVVAGDELAIGVTQTNGAGSQVLSLVSVRCQW